MAKPELGTKRACLECSTKYFDLNRQPIVCPKCGAVFGIATRDKTRPAEAKPEKKVAEDASPEASAVAEKAADDDTIVAADTDGEVEIVSLDEAADASGDDDDGDDEAIVVLPDVHLVIDDDDDDVSDIVVGGEDKDDT